MENRTPAVITFKFKDNDALIIRRINGDEPIEELVREFKFFLQGMTFSDQTINEYIPDVCKTKYRLKGKK